MDYTNKYIKYKNKYLNISNKLYGGTILILSLPEINSNLNKEQNIFNIIINLLKFLLDKYPYDLDNIIKKFSEQTPLNNTDTTLKSDIYNYIELTNAFGMLNVDNIFTYCDDTTILYINTFFNKPIYTKNVFIIQMLEMIKSSSIIPLIKWINPSNDIDLIKTLKQHIYYIIRKLYIKLYNKIYDKNFIKINDVRLEEIIQKFNNWNENTLGGIFVKYTNAEVLAIITYYNTLPIKNNIFIINMLNMLNQRLINEQPTINKQPTINEQILDIIALLNITWEYYYNNKDITVDNIDEKHNKLIKNNHLNNGIFHYTLNNELFEMFMHFKSYENNKLSKNNTYLNLLTTILQSLNIFSNYDKPYIIQNSDDIIRSYISILSDDLYLSIDAKDSSKLNPKYELYIIPIEDYKYQIPNNIKDYLVSYIYVSFEQITIKNKVNTEVNAKKYNIRIHYHNSIYNQSYPYPYRFVTNDNIRFYYLIRNFTFKT